jgi:hypothetical protein
VTAMQAHFFEDQKDQKEQYGLFIVVSLKALYNLKSQRKFTILTCQEESSGQIFASMLQESK